MRKAPWLPLLVAVMGMVLFAPRSLVSFGHTASYDEGNTVVAAWRVLEGDRLYADVWQMHAPGTAWALALAFQLLGTTLFTERLVKLALVGVTVLLLFRLGRRVASSSLAGGAALLFVMLPPANPFLRPNDPAFAATLLAAEVLLGRGYGSGSRVLTVGLCLGMAAAFRLDFGFYACLAAAVFLVLHGQLRRLALLAAGAAIVVTGVASVLVLQGVADEAWEQMVRFPATHYAEHRGLPFVEPLAVLVPLGVALAGVAAALRRAADVSDRAALLLVALLCLAYLGYARARPDPEHTLAARALAAVAAVGLANLVARSLDGRRARACVALALGALVAAAGPGLADTLRAAASLGATAPSTLPRVGPLLRPAPALLEGARLVAERGPEGQAIFVGNERHDRVLVNDVLTYFLADRPSVTRYYNLHPGLATTESVQREIAATLLREPAPLVLLWRAPLWNEPNASARPGSELLDRAIRERRRQADTAGRYSMWVPVE